MATVLLEVRRGPIVECRHYGAIAVADADGRLVAGVGDTGLVTFYRSAAKPLQALPLLASGAAARFGLTAEELAVTTGSHNGEPVHARAVQGILDKVGLEPAALRCGSVPPADPAEAGASGPSPLYHGCSGNHAGLLASCVERGEPTASYTEADHPLQRQLLALVADFLGLAPGDVPVGVDGCGIPTFGGPLLSIARSFAALAAPPPEIVPAYRDAAGRVLDAMAAHPYMVAGRGRYDTDLMRLAGGRVVAKTGAEGLLCLALRERGWGVAIKVEDGSSRALPAIVAALLAQLGALDEGTLVRFTELHSPLIRNDLGAVVGERRPVFALA